MSTQIVIVVALVLSSVVGYLVYNHGAARFAAGKSQCEAQNNAAQAVEIDQARQITERANNVSKKIATTDLDAKLLSIGILRPNSHR
jgi:hypothetical protein